MSNLIPSKEKCSTCDGAGMVPDYGPLGHDFLGPKECGTCKGSGFAPLAEPPKEIGGRLIPKPGDMWEHYSGKKYRIVAIARNSEEDQEADGEGFVVVYTRCGRKKGSSDTWVRPLLMFMEVVNGGKPRFLKIRSAVQ